VERVVAQTEVAVLVVIELALEHLVEGPVLNLHLPQFQQLTTQ
jgi:hypothetical protein